MKKFFVAAALLALASSTLAQSVPTCGRAYDGPTPTDFYLPTNWSTSQPYPAMSNVTGAARSSNVVTLTLASTTGYVANMWVETAGFSDSSFNIGRSTIAATNGITRSGTTATVTTTTDHNLAVGQYVCIEGTSSPQFLGCWVVATVPSSTTFTFTMFYARGATSTGGTVNAGVQLTSVTPTTLVFAQTGADATTTTGTVQSIRQIRPPSGTTFVDLESGCTLYPIFSRQNNPKGDGDVSHFYSTKRTGNKDYSSYPEGPNPYVLIRSGAGGHFIADPNTRSLILSIGGSDGTHDWSRSDADKLFTHTNAKVQYVLVSEGTGTPHDIFDFGAAPYSCTNAPIGGPGDGAAEGHNSQNGTYLPVYCSGPKKLYILDVSTTPGTIKNSLTLPAASVDNVHVFNSGSFVINYGGGPCAPNNAKLTAISRVSGVTTVTVNCGTVGHGLVPGDKVRLMTVVASAGGTYSFNNLFTITAVPDINSFQFNQALADATGSSDRTAGSTGIWEWCAWNNGLAYFDSDGVFNNCSTYTTHGDSGADPDDGADVWIGVSGSAAPYDYNNPCQASMTKLKLASSFWPGGERYDVSAKTPLFCWGTAEGAFGYSIHVSYDPASGYALSSAGCATSSSCRYKETTIPSNWTASTKAFDSMMVLAKVDGTKVYKLNRNLTDDEGTYNLTSRANFDGRNIVYVSDGRFGPKSTNIRAVMIVQPCGGQRCGTDAAAPTLTSVTPSEGIQGNAVDVELAGTNMDGANPVITVSGTGITVSNVVQVSAVKVTARFTIAAAATPGDRTVTYSTDDGTSGPAVFTTVLVSASPTLSSITPTTGGQGRAYTIVLTGTNFDPSQVVNVSGSGVTVSSSFVSSTAITATFSISDTAADGVRTVSVTTDRGTTATQNFTITAKPTVPAQAGVKP